jgi:HD-like signal output (HDOD) protein
VGLPLDSEKLLDGISAAMRLRGGVERTRLGQLVERARHLPSLPDVYVKLQEEIRSDDPAVVRVAALIEQDPALSVRILQLINSPFMGLRREVADVKLAASLVGLQRLTTLVLATGVFKPVSPLDRRLVEQLWQDSLTIGGIARRIAQSEGLDSHGIDEAQLGGLLHDIGELVLFQNWRDEFMQIDPIHRARDEVRIFGATHADISGYLCSTWGLGRVVVDAVTAHHSPAAHPADGGVTAVTAVHVARALVDADMDLEHARLDRDHLEEVGAIGRLDHWVELATDLSPAT